MDEGTTMGMVDEKAVFAKLKQLITEVCEKDLCDQIAYKEEVMDLIFQLSTKQSIRDMFTFLDNKGESFLIHNIGIQAYQKKNYLMAELAFQNRSVSGDYRGNNNLAYMIRRGEITEPELYTSEDAVRLLQDGLLVRNPFALANMALLYGLSMEGEKKWNMADGFIALIHKDEADDIVSWWTELSGAGETEGYLALLWFLRYGLIDETPFGDQEKLYSILRDRIPEIPEFMKEKA